MSAQRHLLRLLRLLHLVRRIHALELKNGLQNLQWQSLGRALFHGCFIAFCLRVARIAAYLSKAACNAPHLAGGYMLRACACPVRTLPRCIQQGLSARQDFQHTRIGQTSAKHQANTSRLPASARQAHQARHFNERKIFFGIITT